MGREEKGDERFRGSRIILKQQQIQEKKIQTDGSYGHLSVSVVVTSSLFSYDKKLIFPAG